MDITSDCVQSGFYTSLFTEFNHTSFTFKLLSLVRTEHPIYVSTHSIIIFNRDLLQIFEKCLLVMFTLYSVPFSSLLVSRTFHITFWNIKLQFTGEPFLKLEIDVSLTMVWTSRQCLWYFTLFCTLLIKVRNSSSSYIDIKNSSFFEFSIRR